MKLRLRAAAAALICILAAESVFSAPAAAAASFTGTGTAEGSAGPGLQQSADGSGRNTAVTAVNSVSGSAQSLESLGPGAAQSALQGAAAVYENGQKISLSPDWTYAGNSKIHTGSAVMYLATSDRKNRIVAVNAGHGTEGGEKQRTLSHPDGTGKVTGGTNAAGAVTSLCVSSGMTFRDGTPERQVTLRMAQILREKLLAAGYDVLMIRDGEDVQLDNIARTVIANNTADIHIALHWDGDGLSSIKGVFYMSVPDGLKRLEPVASHWKEHERLGDCLIAGLEEKVPGIRVWSPSGHGCLDTDLTQTSYSTIPSVDMELGNQCSRHDDSMLTQEADGLLRGIDKYFGF